MYFSSVAETNTVDATSSSTESERSRRSGGVEAFLRLLRLRLIGDGGQDHVAAEDDAASIKYRSGVNHI